MEFESGSRGRLAPGPHTTGHAGPHPAVPERHQTDLNWMMDRESAQRLSRDPEGGNSRFAPPRATPVGAYPQGEQTSPLSSFQFEPSRQVRPPDAFTVPRAGRPSYFRLVTCRCYAFC